MSTSEEVSLELLLLDGSNYTSWSASVLDVFRTMGPQIEQIVDVSISPPHDDLIYLSREEVKCLQLNAQAANVLFSALSEDVLDAVIFGDGKPLGDAHIIWTTLKEMYGNSKCEESNLSLEKPLEECSTSSTNDEPQVILSKGLFDHATSTSSPTYDLLDGNEIVGENNIFTCGTSTFFSSCETNILKEEEACDRWKPNDESTLPRSSTLYTTSHIGLMAKKEKKVANESESESDSDSGSDDDEINQHLARLSKKDKLIVIKFIEKIQEQEEDLYKQEELLVEKIKCLEKLTKKHEKLKCSHASLVQRYENLSIEQTHTINSLSCVAQLEDQNYMLKDKLERLTSKNETLQESHDGLLCSHEKLMESHLMLEVAHEVVVTTVKSYQPHTHKCTYTQVSSILSCANKCCSQASQPSVEHVIVETCDDSIAKENEQLKEEVEMLKRDLIQWKGKCNAQPSQDNHEDMMKKLEKGSTDACIKPYQKGYKSNNGKVKGILKEVQYV